MTTLRDRVEPKTAEEFSVSLGPVTEALLTTGYVPEAAWALAGALVTVVCWPQGAHEQRRKLLEEVIAELRLAFDKIEKAPGQDKLRAETGAPYIGDWFA